MDLKHTCMRTDRLHPMDIVIECPASLLAKEFLVECAANIVNIVNIATVKLEVQLRHRLPPSLERSGKDGGRR